MIEGSTTSNSPQPLQQQVEEEEEDHGVLSNTEDEEDDIEIEEDVDMSNLPTVEQTTTQVPTRGTSTSTSVIPKRERRSSHIMDKLKMVFFEKRKSATSTQQQNKHSRHSHKKRQRPLSYPNLLSIASDEQQPPSLPPHAESSSQPLNLSRHITTPERSSTSTSTTKTTTRPLRMEINS